MHPISFGMAYRGFQMSAYSFENRNTNHNKGFKFSFCLRQNENCDSCCFGAVLTINLAIWLNPVFKDINRQKIVLALYIGDSIA